MDYKILIIINHVLISVLLNCAIIENTIGSAISTIGSISLSLFAIICGLNYGLRKKQLIHFSVSLILVQLAFNIIWGDAIDGLLT